uniref:ATP-dependent RNA helicase A-like n=1 Tax=Fragaria vesca subsp. vesca TaxID=101020 RepID=UPI0005C949C8|nr:PREDICTED: ATP-dependent RNA helicase A-like [Fragaria vesca subsp. vesca]XP_011465989.1 PREDICTED: ATP-dependent RNA helicase A-like [Fragaria vesca subsp. vesca]XP_011465990.1 PREDICTED: ATP-dependent RNA helicase A-like [Fragaria vesca subsp. vesca]XP_011465991.1 PREDICTED: ATP-dependent RNA helicase A-like [Fragaria vesca subsp. vesca]
MADDNGDHGERENIDAVVNEKLADLFPPDFATNVVNSDNEVEFIEGRPNAATMDALENFYGVGNIPKHILRGEKQTFDVQWGAKKRRSRNRIPKMRSMRQDVYPRAIRGPSRGGGGAAGPRVRVHGRVRFRGGGGVGHGAAGPGRGGGGGGVRFHCPSRGGGGAAGPRVRFRGGGGVRHGALRK